MPDNRFVLDNRLVPPLGTYFVNVDGMGERLVIFAYPQPRNRILGFAGIAGGVKDFQLMPDITDQEKVLASAKTQNIKGYYAEKSNKAREDNHQEHCDKKWLWKPEVPQEDTVIIIGAGEFDVESIPEGIPVITLGNAIMRYTSDYYVGSDIINSDYVKKFPKDMSKTYAFLSTKSHSGYLRPRWKGVGMYTTTPFVVPGLPHFLGSEGCAGDALHIAVNLFKAKKIILLGIEQPSEDKNYFFQGIILQGFCWWYAKKGIDIWSCTPKTTVLGGVIRGSIEEALA